MDFNNKQTFAELEDKAIDGLLDYDSFPPCEYKYFSRLAKLGYLNRTKGWSVEICEAKQREYRLEYQRDCGKRDFFGKISRYMQTNIKASQMKRIELRKAQTVEDRLTAALEVIALITCDETIIQE
jgi:hypothetical protein